MTIGASYQNVNFAAICETRGDAACVTSPNVETVDVRIHGIGIKELRMIEGVEGFEPPSLRGFAIDLDVDPVS